MKTNYTRVIYLIIFIISGVGLLSTLFYYFYTPKPNLASNQENLNLKQIEVNISRIFDRNVFNKDGIFPSLGQLPQSKLMCSGIPQQSKLPYKVIGIIFGGNSVSSMAILQNKNTESIIILKQNDSLQQTGYISNIDARRVWITETGCPEYLDLPKAQLPPSRVRKNGRGGNASDKSYSESGFDRVGTNTNVTREWVDDILNNKLSSALNDAFVVPHIVNGRIDGFAITQIEPMSVYDKLGLKDGDVITSINGIPLNDAGRAIQTLNGLKNENDISLQVLRNGQPTTFKVNVNQ